MKTMYTDVSDEYRALRERSGLIDYEGALVARVTGAGAAAFLAERTTRVTDFLLEGQISPALVLDARGTVVGEVLIHCDGTEYIIEGWPGQSAAVRDHLASAAAAQDDVDYVDESGSVHVLGLEGPESFRLVQAYLSFPVASMAYNSFVIERWRDGPLLISRTGVSGEYGFKLHVPPAGGTALRAELLAAGAQACGREALDVCRMEMRFVNLEREGAGGVDPFDVGLQWMVDFHHEFTGRTALLARWEEKLRRLPVCWTALERIDPQEVAGASLTVEGQPVGEVTHAVLSPGLGRVIGTARVEPDVAASGVTLTLGTETPVSTVSAPFLVASSFQVGME